MIPSRYQPLTFSFFMSLLMSGVMSLAMKSIEHLSLVEAISHWPLAWAISMVVAFPASMLLVPLAQWLVASVVATN